MRGGSHTLTVRTRTPTVDAEGQISYANSDATVKGRVMITNVGIGDDGGKNTNQPEAVAWVPTGTTVTDAAQIVVAGLDSLLNGTYNIDAIQHTPSHVRLFLLGTRS
jgi:hypothetical protein